MSTSQTKLPPQSRSLDRNKEVSPVGASDSHILPRNKSGVSTSLAAKSEKVTPAKKRPIAKKQVKLREGSLSFFFDSLALIIGSGISIVRALETAMDKDTDPALNSVVEKVASDVANGKRLSEAMSAHAKVFSKLQIDLIRVGENSGSLVHILGLLGHMERRMTALKRKAISDVSWSVLLLIILLPLGAIFAGVALAPIEKVLHDFGESLPLPVAALVDVSSVFLDPLGFLTTLLLISLAVVRMRKEIRERRLTLFRHVLFWLPKIGKAMRLNSAALFAQSMAIQLQAGVDILQATQSSLFLCGNPDWSKKSMMVTKELERGHQLGKALTLLPDFPDVVLNSVNALQETGKLPATFESILTMLEIEIEYQTQVMSAALQPLIFGFAGLATGALVISVMLPISRVVAVVL